MLRRLAPRRLQIESLETRRLMAGNVKVSASGSDLIVEGDDLRNAVEIRQSSPGVYKITGTTIGGADTKINNQPNGTFIFRGEVDNLRISLGGGADKVDVGIGDQKEISIRGNLVISGGAGSDWTSVRNVKVGKALVVNTGTGVRDHTFISEVTVGDDLIVSDPLKVNTGDWDEVLVSSVTVKDQMEFTFRGGNDTVNIISSAADGIYASLGEGDDFFRMLYTKHKSKFDISGGGGKDTFFAPVFNKTRYFGSGFETVKNS